MAKRITLELRSEVIIRAREVAERSRRRVEDVLAEWLDDYAHDLPVEMMSDDQVLDLCRAQMKIIQQQELAALLASHRERDLTPDESARLDELLQLHRRVLVRKARAIEVARARGLRRRTH